MDLTLWQYQFRIIMLGDSTVGKSSLLKRYTEDLFLETINQTVGVDFYVHFLEVEPGVRVKLQFWDTAGQERFRWGLTQLVSNRNEEPVLCCHFSKCRFRFLASLKMLDSSIYQKIPSLSAPGLLALCHASLLKKVKHILQYFFKKMHANIPVLFNQCLLSSVTVYLSSSQDQGAVCVCRCSVMLKVANTDLWKGTMLLAQHIFLKSNNHSHTPSIKFIISVLQLNEPQQIANCLSVFTSSLHSICRRLIPHA